MRSYHSPADTYCMKLLNLSLCICSCDCSPIIPRANDVLAPRRVMYGAVHPNSNKTRHFAGIPNAHYHHLLISECVPAFGKEKKQEWAIFLGAAIC